MELFLDAFFEFFDQRMKQIGGIGRNGDIRHLHHRRLRVFIDGDDEIRFAKASGVLNRTTDTEGKKDFGLDMFTRLSDQRTVIGPARINDRPRRAYIAAQESGQVIELFEIAFIAHAAAAADNHRRVFNRVSFLRRPLIFNQAYSGDGQIGG